jgi:hypothetical protein
LACGIVGILIDAGQVRSAESHSPRWSLSFANAGVPGFDKAVAKSRFQLYQSGNFNHCDADA